jgi:antitoxin HicB
MKKSFRIIITPESEGGFTVMVPSLPGCITWGENIEHAKLMAGEAIDVYLEELQANGEPIPDDTNSLELSLLVD